jgi:hypothetical protein
MEVQNISAQLFQKQLPREEKPINDDFLLQTDANIENAFQKQLDLSDFYKGQSVFDKIKQEFIDQASPPPTVPVNVIPSNLAKVVPSKESFGKSDNSKLYLLIAMVILFIIVFLLLKSK